MALVLANRIQETTTTTGTGTITLAGAASGFQSFAVVGNGNTTYYTITSGTAWEVGIGTYTSAGTTLARTTILASSNAGAAITLAGTSTVFGTYPTERAVSTDNTATLTNKTLSLEAYSTATTVTAGTNAQGQGALTNDTNIITTTSSNPSGVTLPAVFTGARIFIINKGTNPVNVYPASGAQINGKTANTSISLSVNDSVEFIGANSSAWYTVAGYSNVGQGFVSTSLGGTGFGGTAPFTANGALWASSASALSCSTLPIAAGGTNSTSTPLAGGIIYGTGSAYASTSSGASGKPLLSGGTGAPSFGTLLPSGGGTGSTSTPSDGQVLIGSSSTLTYAPATLTAGSGISISNGSGSITISTSGGGSTAVTALPSTSIFSSPTTVSTFGVTNNRILLIFDGVSVSGDLLFQFSSSGSTVTSSYSYNTIVSSFAVSNNTGFSSSSINLSPSPSPTMNTVSGHLWVEAPFSFAPFSGFVSVNGTFYNTNGNTTIPAGTCSAFISSGNAGIVISGSSGLSGGTIYAYCFS